MNRAINRNLAPYTLLAANMFVVYVFFRYGGSVLQVLWIYFMQLIIYGFVYVYTTLKLTTTYDGVKPSKHGLLLQSVFFVIIYGFLNCGYLIFLLILTFDKGVRLSVYNSQASNTFGTAASKEVILINAGLFALHYILFLLSQKPGDHGKKDLVKVFNRLLPMHLIIFLAPILIFFTGLSIYVFVVFMIIKTVVELTLLKDSLDNN